MEDKLSVRNDEDIITNMAWTSIFSKLDIFAVFGGIKLALLIQKRNKSVVLK